MMICETGTSSAHEFLARARNCLAERAHNHFQCVYAIFCVFGIFSSDGRALECVRIKTLFVIRLVVVRRVLVRNANVIYVVVYVKRGIERERGSDLTVSYGRTLRVRVSE